MKRDWTITLTSDQIKRIEEVAKSRQSTNRGASNPDGAIINSYKADRIGSIGEEAVSAAMQLEWDGKHFSFEDWLEWRKTGNDVSGLEVKCTDHPYGRLWVRERENVKLDAPYILVKAHKYPTVTLIGWAYGKEIKQEKHLEPGLYNKPAYYIPSASLRPMDDLVALVNKRETQTLEPQRARETTINNTGK